MRAFFNILQKHSTYYTTKRIHEFKTDLVRGALLRQVTMATINKEGAQSATIMRGNKGCEKK